MTSNRLILQGIPTVGFSVLGVCVTGVLLGGCAFFMHLELTASKGSINVHVAILGLTFIVVAGFLCLCIALLFQRERLVLDRVTSAVTHTEWWVLGSRSTEKTYPLDRVAGVSLEESERRSPGRGGGTTRVLCTRLLLDRPRAAIVLESSETGFTKNVEPTARAVAQWLDFDIRRLGSGPLRRKARKARSDLPGK